MDLPNQPRTTPRNFDRYTAQFHSLTGFRGICIFWVIFSHLPIHMHPVLENIANRWGIGVDFFLAISGFLVTRSLEQCVRLSKQHTLSNWHVAREFLLRRFCRIFPPYFLLLAALGIFAMWIDSTFKARLADISEILPSLPLFYSNYSITAVIDRVPPLLISTWSMAFQEQFYLILILYGCLGGVRRLPGLLLFSGFLSIATRLYYVLWHWRSGTHAPELQFWLHLRFDALSWACLAWIFYEPLSLLWSTPSRARLSWTFILTGIALVLFGHSNWNGDLAQAILYCFKGPLLALMVRGLCELDRSKGFAFRALQGKWISQVGLAAYEIYLVNEIVITGLLKARITSPIPFTLLTYGLSTAAGVIWFQIFGKPVQKWLKNHLSDPAMRENRAPRAIKLSLRTQPSA